LNDLHVATPVGLNFAVQCHHLAGLEAIPQIGTVKPQALNAGPALGSGHLENRHAAGTEKAGISDFGDDGSHLPGAEFGDAARVQTVFIAERQVTQQVVDSLDPLSCQNLRQSWPNSLHVLDRCIQVEHLHGC
jgi:hypothetical protein